MLKYLSQTQSLGWIHNQNTVYEIFSIERDLNVLRKDISVVFDVLVGLLNSIVFKGRLSEEQGVHDDANRPNVDLIGMPLLLQNLRSNVVGGAADGFFGVAFVFYFG